LLSTSRRPRTPLFFNTQCFHYSGVGKKRNLFLSRFAKKASVINLSDVFRASYITLERAMFSTEYEGIRDRFRSASGTQFGEEFGEVVRRG